MTCSTYQFNRFVCDLKLTSGFEVESKRKKADAKKIGKHKNYAQEAVLIAFMEKQTDLGKGCMKGDRTAVDVLWNDITNESNSQGPPQKDASGWKKVWIDWKYSIKKKLVHNRTEARATGGGPYNKFVISPAEDSEAKICGIYTAIEGISHTREFGEVELENVPIRKDALRSFGIPVQAFSGNIGKIKLQIPVRQFRTAPWCIIIERVYGVFGPKNLNDWDDEKEKLAEYEYKISELDVIEAKWRVEKGYTADSYYSTSYTSWLNYGTSLATNILENLELKINDVHLRYEDTITVPSTQFAAGLKINSLTVQSCDSNWIPGCKLSNDRDISFKLIELNDLSVYFDKLEEKDICSKLLSKDLFIMSNLCSAHHHYLLHPTRARAQFKRERCKQAIRSKSRPRIYCEVLIPAVKMSISDVQYKEIAECVYGLRLISRTRSYKLMRPSCTVSENVLLWWKYAAKCHGFVYQSKDHKWLIFRENLRYIRIYKQLLLNPSENITEEAKEFKLYMEKTRSLQELNILRNVCYTNVLLKDLSLKAHHINQGKSMLFHWFPNWWGWYKTSDSTNQTQDDTYTKIENDILSALEDSMENDTFSKRDAVLGYFTFVLVDGQLLINTDDVSNDITYVNMEMEFKNLKFLVEMKPRFNSYHIGVSLGSVCLKDKLTQNTEFMYIVRPQEWQKKPATTASFKGIFEREPDNENSEPWLQFSYEKGPPDIQSDIRLIIKSRSLDIVYNKQVFVWLVSFFAQPFNELLLKYRFVKRSKTHLKFLNNWKHFLMGNEINDYKKNWTLEMDISAPRIILVDNFVDKNSCVVIVDFGRFQMIKKEYQKKESATTPGFSTINEDDNTFEKDSEDDNFMTPCSTPPGSKISIAESPTLCLDTSNVDYIVNIDSGLESAFHNKIYDKYLINLTDLQVLVCRNHDRNYSSFKNAFNFHILEKFSICLQLERRVIYTIDPDYPSLTLYGTLPKIVAHISEEKLDDFFRILYPLICGTGAEKTQEQIFCAELEDEGDVFEFQQNFINTNLMIVQFVIGQMTLEVQSSEKSIAELQVIGVRAGVTKRSNDTHVSMSVHGLLLVDAIQSFGPDFELLLASHRHVGMDTISGSLRQSEPCSPTCPGSPDPSTRERPVSPHLINTAMDDTEEGKRCLDLDFDEAHALITVDLNLINLADNNDFIQIANITFNNLDIIANQETIVELFGFVKRLLNSHKSKFKSTFMRSAQHFSKSSSTKKNMVENVRTEICFDFNRLNILVLRSIKKDDSLTGRKVGTLTMSEAKIHATIGKDVSVMGSLGGVQIIDITPEGINHQRIFSVGKDPLTDTSEFTRSEVFCALSNELYGSNTEDVQLDQINALTFQIYRNKDSLINVKVRMASVWYIHRPRFIQEINLCVSQFKHFLKNFAMSIRNKATDMAKEMVQHMQNIIEPKTKGNIVRQLSIDVVLNTPVLVLPRSDESLDVLVANLGKITAYNAHEQNESLISTRHENEYSNIWANDTYFIDIRNINLFSLNTSRRKELRLLPLPKLDEFYSCHSDAIPVLHDTAILCEIVKLSEQTKDNIQWTLKNTLNVEGSVTECLQLSLSRKQYEQVIASLAHATQLNFDAYSKENNIAKSDTVVTTKDSTDSTYAFEEIFETNLVFKIPVFQIHLKNEHNVSLIDITFREFSAKYNRKKNDVEVEVLLRSILMEDLKCAADSNLRNMVDSSSDCEKDIDRRNNNFSSCPNLSRLHFEHSKLSTSMPCKLNYPIDSMYNDKRNISLITIPKVPDDNLVIYKSRIKNSSITEAGDYDETKSSINFNCLNLTVSVDRWFAVFDFFGLISNCDTKNLSTLNNKVTNENISSLSELKVSVRSLNVILVRNEIELSKVNISYAFFKILKTNLIQSVEGRLKSISLYDLTHFGNLYREKFSTSGPEALSFSYKRLSVDEKLEDSYLKEDAKLRIQMSSVRYIHTKRFLAEITLFIKELLQLQSPVIRRIKMKDVQRNLNERAIQIGLEINAASPIILLPLCYHSNYVLVADLGKFTLNNNFHFANGNTKSLNEILDVMYIDLVNINLFAGERVLRTCKSYECSLNECFNIGNFTIKKMGSNLFKETCHLKLRVERNTNSNISHNYPDLSVKGTLSKLNGIVNVQQYKLIRGLFTYNLGEIIDDIYYNYSFNLCESIEKLNTICTKYESEEVKDSTVWNTMSINLQLENVSILLAEEQTFNSEDQPLACVNFIKSFLEIDTYSDGSQDIDLVSSEILVVDSRQNNAQHFSNNIFKHILKPTRRSSLKDLVQAEIHSRKKSGSSKYTILLNNMRVMAILDCLESIKNFLEEEPNLFSSITPAWRNKLFKHPSHKFQPEKADSVELVLNITDSELVFVENVEVIDTNAIILKNTTVLKYKQSNNMVPISIDINHLEIFSCILGAEDESALSIIDPFTLNMELKDNCFSVVNHKQLSIRLSYNDVKLFTKMFQSIPNQTKTSQKFYKYGKTDFEVIAPLIAMGFKQRDCWDAMEINNYNLNDSALWLSQRKQVKQKNPSLEVRDISLIANFISICVIDDCMDADVPLLELSLSNLKFSQTLSTTHKLRAEGTPLYIEGHLETIIASDYYNRRLSGWEPIMEPWECLANWKYCAADSTKKSIISFNVTSKQLLKINITTTLIELCEIVRNNWMRDYYDMEPNHFEPHPTQNAVSNFRRRSPFVPFVLKNLTGEPLLFKTLYSLPGGITRTEINQQDMMSNWLAAQQNEIVPFDFGPQTKLRHMNSHKLNLHQILVQIQGWTLVGPISIDKVGTYFRYSTLDLQYKKRNRIVFDITLFGSAQKMITIRSALTIINKLDKRLLLKMEVKHEDKVAISVMDPKEHLSVPLRLVDSLIYFKPCASLKDLDKIIGNIRKDTTVYIDKDTFLRITKTESVDLYFSTCGISWMSCSKDSVEELFTCFGENNAIFHTLVQIKRNKYPHRDSNLPGHTIMLLPPLKIKNLLCCDLLFKLSESNQGRINPSDTLNIHTINACESFNLSITLDNYKLSGQLKIPMGHTGVVEPKLKLIDVLNRELYLRVSIQQFQGKGIEIFISAPIWIINKSGLPLVYRQEGMNQLGSGQFEEHEKARVISPLLFSFTDQGSPSLEIRLGNSYGNCNSWCKSFNLHKNVFYRQLKAGSSKGSYAIGIHVKRGRGVYSCTTFVILSPRFQLYNRTARKLEFAQKCDVNKPVTTNTEQIITAPAGCNFPFHWPNYEQEPLLCVRIKDIDFCHWSHGIPMNEVHSLYLNVRNDLGDMYFIRLEVISKRATYYFLFTEANTLPPPIRVDNYSEIAIYFHQCGCKPHWRTCVRPQSSLAYALDDPMGAHVLKIEAPGGNIVDFPLNKVAISQSITYANFIYIAFKDTFLSENEISADGFEGQQLVLGVKEKKVILTKKCAGDRSQLWLMNSNGQLEHEGSSPPVELGQCYGNNGMRMVLDLETAPNPNEYTNLVVRPPNKQRITTQTWRFENGRLMCHANMCVQVRNEVFGLRPGSEVVLGRIQSKSWKLSSKKIPSEHCIEIQKLRPGSGHLEIFSKMDGPIRTIQIRDVKICAEEIVLIPDPAWNHSSVSNRTQIDECISNELCLKFDLQKGLGVSVVTRQPCEELAFITLETIVVDIHSTPFVKSYDVKICDLQIDNQLLDTPCPVLLHTIKSRNDEFPQNALELRAKMLPSPNKNAVIFEFIKFNMNPCIVVLEERLILKAANFFGCGKRFQQNSSLETDYVSIDVEENVISTDSKRFYFETLSIGSSQVRLSMFTAPKLTPELLETKKIMSLTLIKFEDALIEFDKFCDKHHFEPIEVYLRAIKLHYINQIKWHAASILGSVDFLGNPLGFANDLSEGVSGLIFEGSVKSLVKNVTHGISNSTAKLTETLSDGLGRVVLDEHDNETRQKMLEIQSNTSGNHLAAGLKGLGFGLLGGVTSIVRHTYIGAQSDGIPGFLSGLGRGIVGTVTKPIIGVLDLAAETASAVRETSKSSGRKLPDRKRLPRCVTGAPGGLLPVYSYRQSKGQQYLYIINRRNFSEKLISYEPNLCNDKDAKLRLLITNEYIRIFSRCEEDPAIMFECHLSEVLSCHPLITNAGNTDTGNKHTPNFYIEISTNLPKITRPRVKCQNEENAERAARCINYAKSVFDEREQSVTDE